MERDPSLPADPIEQTVARFLDFAQGRGFVARWAALGLDDEAMRALENAIMDSPGVGAVVPGAGGLRKMRFAPPGRAGGKSGALRVCYAHIAECHFVALLAVYAKNERADLTPEEKAIFGGAIAAMRDYCKGRRARGDVRR